MVLGEFVAVCDARIKKIAAGLGIVRDFNFDNIV